jgi:hypothetical protein
MFPAVPHGAPLCTHTGLTLGLSSSDEILSQNGDCQYSPLLTALKMVGEGGA